VTGGSRGAGRGIAIALGAHGYKVYVTGRTRRAGEALLDGTIGETAELVTAAGGQGIAVRVDHRNDEEVKDFFDQVRADAGRLDLLVSNAAQIGDELLADAPFWEKPLSASTDLVEVGIRSSLVASYYAAPLLIDGGGLVAFTSAPGAVHYQYGAAYGAHKASLDKFAADMAVDFRPFNVAVVSIWMGAVLTQRVNQIMEAGGPEYAFLADIGETPEFTGHVIAALANDPNVIEVSGRTLIGAEVALDYGIKDRDSRQPPSFRDLRNVHPAADYKESHTMISEERFEAVLRELKSLKDRQAILDDRQAILDVISRQSRGHDRHDAELQNSCFWEDGVDEHGQWVTPGPQYGEWANKTHAASATAHMHNLTTHSCEINGNTAHAESYVLGIFQPRHKEGRAQFLAGRYIDRLEKRNGEWRIVVRRIVMEVVLEGDSHWLDSPIALTFPKGSWDESDISYTRPLQVDSVSPFWDGTTR
jgi:NAD(P)-dependent dehydrogenase (short-subunit alcohol dehydrogenase family)